MEGALAIGPRVIVTALDTVAISDVVGAGAAVRKEARPEHGVAPLPDVGDAADVSEGVVAAVEMVREEDVGDLLVEVVLELRLAHGLRDGLEDVDEGDVHGGLHGGRVDEIEQSIQAAHRRVLALGHGRVGAREQLALAILIGQSLAGVAGGVAGGVRARPVHEVSAPVSAGAWRRCGQQTCQCQTGPMCGEGC